MSAPIPCPLCASSRSVEFHRDRRRPYRQCQRCTLVYVPADYLLDAVSERAEYDLHENTMDDPGYRRFLSRLYQPLTARLEPGGRGLDFGCGPGPALAAMFTEAGFDMSLYDIFYAPDEGVFSSSYDFISATEVVEHLHHPARELPRLWRCLCPGGWLGVMTKLVTSPEAFANWHYKNDPTHVCFFSRESWHWWADNMNARVEFIGADVILLQKSSEG